MKAAAKFDLDDIKKKQGKRYASSLKKVRESIATRDTMVPVQKAFETLGLQTFLTAGEKEVRAWTIRKGTKAPQAAGVIHGDFEKHFIKADCISFDEFVAVGGWAKARPVGKVRMEGREYVMRDGDVVEFKVGV
jgi:ribosome-binding ATPase YchF (GTP1/OBG family)